MVRKIQIPAAAPSVLRRRGADGSLFDAEDSPVQDRGSGNCYDKVRVKPLAGVLFVLQE
jgi:hypothetical protein